MKRLTRTLLSTVLLAASSVALAAEPTAWERIKSYSHESKEQAVAEGKKMIAATDEQIEVLKKSIAKSTGDTKAAHEKNMAELKEKRKAAAAELSKMQKSAAGTWDATKEGFSKAYQALTDSYQKAADSAKSK